MKHYQKIMPPELAKELKEAGFPQSPYHHCYDAANGVEYILVTDREFIVAPRYAEVLDWLLDKGLSVEISCCEAPDSKIAWYPSVFETVKGYKVSWEEMLVPTWFEAIDVAIEQSLKIINIDNNESKNEK